MDKTFASPGMEGMAFLGLAHREFHASPSRLAILFRSYQIVAPASSAGRLFSRRRYSPWFFESNER